MLHPEPDLARFVLNHLTPPPHIFTLPRLYLMRPSLITHNPSVKRLFGPAQQSLVIKE